MKYKVSLKITAAILICVFTVFGLACQNQTASNSAAVPVVSGEGGTTPTDAYKKLYTAVKAKQPDAVKAVLSEKSLGFAQSVSERQNQPLAKVLENGFTATTFSETMPEIRDERVKGDSASVEVYNSKDSRWEDLPFIKQNGSWKLAIGDLFAGTFESPGKGRAQLESEAANANGQNLVPIQPKVDGNYTSRKPINPAAANAKTNVEKK
ncbi:MAG TPA: hypothetical protein VGD05_05290 [Pyrinomonadaceae bacterium]|jgi:hypothetical protein